MKKKLFILISLIAILFGSCVSVKTNKNGIPLGQAKKVTGSQSAAPYAPVHPKIEQIK